MALPVAKNLETPWALDCLPDGSLVFTERLGRVRLIDTQDHLLPEPLLVVANMATRGEGGLLGIAVHPNFAENQFIYILLHLPERQLVPRDNAPTTWNNTAIAWRRTARQWLPNATYYLLRILAFRSWSIQINRL